MRYRWATTGDLNAFFGLVFDNLTNLVILAAILTGTFGFSREIVLTKMIPGTALGVLIGDLIYTRMAFRLARREGREDVTAMPLGIDTPSLFGLSFGVLGPARLMTGSDERAWQIGMAVLVLSGLFKVACAFAGPWIHRVLPRAALLGSIAGVALLLIAYLPLHKVLAIPVVGFLSLGIILMTLIARLPLPGRLPGALAAAVVGSALYHGMGLAGFLPEPYHGLPGSVAFAPAIPWPTLGFLQGLAEAWAYVPLALPLALGTVVGGIDNTESAAVAGDRYPVRGILLTEGVATLAAGLCGGVIQTTPYIGHPAYKAMGGRAAYTLATALFIGFGGIFGFLSFFVELLPEAAIAPILIFIGLEITAQAFVATPPRHAPAVALCFLPAIGYLVFLEQGGLLRALGVEGQALPAAARAVQEATLIAGQGFIFTALLWGAALASLIDGALPRAALFLSVAAVATLTGMIHNPLPDGTLFLPWRLPVATPGALAGGYLCFAGLAVVIWATTPSREGRTP